MAADILIKFDGITGESTMDKHDGWIECESFQEGISCPGSTSLGTGSAVGKPEFHPFSLSLVQGKHTNEFKKAMFDGKHFATVEVHFMKQVAANVTEPYYTMKATVGFVIGHSLGKVKDSLASESVVFQAEQAEWEYFAQDDQGKLTSTGSVSYDQKVAKSA